MKLAIFSLLLAGCQSCVPVGGGVGGSPGAGGSNAGGTGGSTTTAPDAATAPDACALACAQVTKACAKPRIAPSECEARCHEAAIQLHGPSAAPLCAAGVLVCNDKSRCIP